MNTFANQHRLEMHQTHHYNQQDCRQSPPNHGEHAQVSFHPIRPYIFKAASNSEMRWASEISTCSLDTFYAADPPSPATCYALLQALSNDSRFTIRPSSKHVGKVFDVEWHVPGYWLVTAAKFREGCVTWVQMLHFRNFVVEVVVLEERSIVSSVHK